MAGIDAKEKILEKLVDHISIDVYPKKDLTEVIARRWVKGQVKTEWSGLFEEEEVANLITEIETILEGGMG